MKTLKKQLRTGSRWFLLTGVLLSPLSHAIEFKVNGFASLVAGAVLSGENGDYMENVSGYDCPCFVGDYANAGVYEGSHWDFAPDSRAGIQLVSIFNDEWSFTTQLVGHGGNDMKPELSAMFGSWKLDSGVNFNLGRQRLPLFYFSDFYDVGYAYPWIRVPADLYGWPISSYNGASVDFSDDLGEGTYKLSLLAGEEEDHNDQMNGDIYYGSKEFVTEWKDMLGVSASYLYDWFDVRAVYMTNKTFAEADYGTAGGGKYLAYDHIHQEFTGLAFNMDFYNVIIRAEGNIFRVLKANFDSYAKMLAIGYRMGTVTPMLTYSRYDDADPDFGRSHYRTSSATVRWDVIRNTALKIQYDVVDDKMDWVGYTGFIGDTHTLSVGVDYVF